VVSQSRRTLPGKRWNPTAGVGVNLDIEELKYAGFSFETMKASCPSLTRSGN
jgi:hypothetical protein